MFNWFKRVPNVELEEKIKILSKKIAKIEDDILSIEVSIDTIRNKVLRKIQFKRKKETEALKEDDDEEEKPNGWEALGVL